MTRREGERERWIDGERGRRRVDNAGRKIITDTMNLDLEPWNLEPGTKSKFSNFELISTLLHNEILD